MLTATPQSMMDKLSDALLWRTEVVFRRMDLVATGQTLRETRVATSVDRFAGGRLTMFGPDHAFNVGNRGPGKRPPVEPLKRWIAARGLQMNPFALQNYIAKKGTARRRRNERNPYEVAGDEFLRFDTPKIMSGFARDLSADVRGLHRTLKR